VTTKQQKTEAKGSLYSTVALDIVLLGFFLILNLLESMFIPITHTLLNAPQMLTTNLPNPCSHRLMHLSQEKEKNGVW